MAEEFLEEIYEDSMLLFELKKELELAYAKHIYIIVKKLNELFPKFGNVCNKYAVYDYDEAMKLWNSLDKNMLLENNDVIGMMSRLERDFLPQYQKYLLTLGGISVDDGEGIRFESSDSGFLSLYITGLKRYVNSMIDPMWEAYQQAKELFDPRIREYYFFGAGLCYLPYQLYLYSEGRAHIHIYETKEKIVEYGRKYGVLDWIPEENVEITVGSFSQFIKEAIGDYKKYTICELLAFNVSAEELPTFIDAMTDMNTVIDYSKLFQINFYANISNIKKSVLDFNWHIFKDDFIVVAGGPSVDDRMEYIRSMQGKKTIFAVGTIFKKLLQFGITPDAVVVIDMSELIMNQFEGCLDSKVPIFIGHHAYYGLGEKYQGEKYLVFSYMDLKEKEVLPERLKDVPVLPNGGNVATYTTSLAIYFGAETIELIGADFAYPGNMSHASGTWNAKILPEERAVQRVKGVDGEMLPTEMAMQCYRYHMEELIEYNPRVKFFNLTSHGAEIKGAKWVKNPK